MNPSTSYERTSSAAPWAFEYDDGGKSSAITASDARIFEPVCIIPHDDMTEEGEQVILANARLIASAPELLEALRNLEPMFDNDSPLLTVYAKEIATVRALLERLS